MWFFALGAYFIDVIRAFQFMGISLTLLCLTLYCYPILITLKKTKRRTTSNFISYLINLLELIGYTVIIYFLGGINALWLSPIYVVLIFYIGVFEPKKLPFIIASSSSFCLLVMMMLEHFEIIPSQTPLIASVIPVMHQVAIAATVMVYLHVAAYVSHYIGNVLKNNRKKLRSLNLELENQVLERTNHLKELNLSLIEEVKARKKSIIALKNSENRYRSLVETMQEGLVEVDANWVMTFVNGRFAGMLGYRNNQLIGRKIYAFVSEAYKEAAKREYTRRWQGETGKYELELVRSDGKKITVFCSPKPSYSPEGIYLGSLGVMTDITELKDVQKVLSEERDRLKDALSTVKKLGDLLPICSSCKKIRDDQGYWNQIESYIEEHSETEFSHGICPECARALYPDIEVYKDG